MKRLLPLLVMLFLALSIATAAVYEGQQETCSEDSETCSIENNGNVEIEDLDSLMDSMEHDENSVCIVYFYSPTCAHCHNIKPLISNLEKKYRDEIFITKLDVSEPKNVAIYNQFCTAQEYSGNEIPMIAVNDVVLIGEIEIRKHLEDEIERGMLLEEKICPIEGMSCHSGNSTGTEPLLFGVDRLSFISLLPLVMITGIGDGINPCAFAVLLFIMAFLQEISGNKRRLLRVTIGYIASFMVVNILLGVIYYLTSIRLGAPDLIRNIAIGFAILAGLINLKDVFAYGRGFSLEIPKFSKRYIESLASKASVPASIVLGGLVAILEAPCSVPIYLTVLEVLKGQGMNVVQIMPHIIIYNIMFILPIAVLAFFIYYGAEAKALEGMRTRYRRLMKLSLAVILFVLAGLMIAGVI